MLSSLSPEDDWGTFALACLHRGGQVREAALCAFAARAKGPELPFILLRINDWASPVRQLARTLVVSRLNADNAPDFLKCLPLVVQLGRCRRSDTSWLFEAISQLFVSASVRSVLHDGLTSVNPTIRRTCLRMVDESKIPIAKSAFASATTDSDPTTRYWAVRRSFALADSEEIESLFQRLARDPFMPIRREALDNLVRRSPTLPLHALQDALLDRHASIRSFARFYLRDSFDVAQFYREEILASAPLHLEAAILGLGESGQPTDAETPVQFLASSKSRLRRASVLAIGTLDASRHKNSLLLALADPSPRVSLAAFTALKSIREKIRVCEIVPLLSSSHPVVTRRNALRVISYFGKWDQIPLYLSICRDPALIVSLIAASKVLRWQRQYISHHTVPTEAQIASLDLELRQSQDFLDRPLVRELESICHDWRN